MTAAAVREKLREAYPAREAFTVEFSGKKNNRVNGTYCFGTKIITIHERNFESNNDLLYTAFHELAHHLQHTEYGEHKKRSHTKLFWSIFHDLLEKAGEKGIYVRERTEAVKRLAEQAKALDREIAKLQRKLGIILGDLEDVCREDGLRFEDVLEHDVGMAKATAKKAAAAASILVDGELGQDAQALVIRAGSAEKREAIIEQVEKGKTIAQIEEMAKPRAVIIRDAVTELLKEKRRIEAAIKSLQSRYEEITRELERTGKETEAA
jgi:prefoldin subunit 5